MARTEQAGIAETVALSKEASNLKSLFSCPKTLFALSKHAVQTWKLSLSALKSLRQLQK